MSYRITLSGVSRSFPDTHQFIDGAKPDGTGVVYIGSDAGARYVVERSSLGQTSFVALELGNECLGVYTGDDSSARNVFGFARFRLGRAEPTKLVELVTPPAYDPAALVAAKAAFEASGLVVAVCGDFPGRIVNRLVRPYFNAVLRRYDEKLATAEDLDTTLRMGLGYPEGPLELLNRTGLAEHAETSQALYEALGDPAYMPARLAMNARLARSRSDRQEHGTSPDRRQA